MNTRILILAFLVLGLVAHTDRAAAYEITESDRQAMPSPFPSTSRDEFPSEFGAEAERQRMADLNRYQQQNFDRQQREGREGQFDPRAYTGPPPFSFNDGQGRTTVCRRGYLNSITCER